MTLEEAIVEVKGRIATLGAGDRISEADTKSSLINPILKALGWHIGNLAEVREEYSMPGGGRADYALLENNKPVVIVEAKSYGCSLDEKSRIQYINYAQSAAIPLAILTNGNDWEFHYAAEGKIEASKRTIGELSFSKSSSEDIYNTLLMCSHEKSTREKLVDERIINIWLPFVREALLATVNSRTTKLISLLRSTDVSILPHDNELIRDCLASIAAQGSNHINARTQVVIKTQAKERIEPASDKQSRGSVLDKKFRKLPDSLYTFTQNIRRILCDKGLEEREYDYYTYHSPIGECIAMSRRIKNQTVILYPIKTHFLKWSQLPSEFKTLVNPYKQNWFRTDFEVIIRKGQEDLGIQFVSYFLDNIHIP